MSTRHCGRRPERVVGDDRRRPGGQRVSGWRGPGSPCRVNRRPSAAARAAFGDVAVDPGVGVAGGGGDLALAVAARSSVSVSRCAAGSRSRSWSWSRWRTMCSGSRPTPAAVWSGYLEQVEVVSLPADPPGCVESGDVQPAIERAVAIGLAAQQDQPGHRGGFFGQVTVAPSALVSLATSGSCSSANSLASSPRGVIVATSAAAGATSAAPGRAAVAGGGATGRA